jgi:outer membrane lipoprotein-sorting protein
VVRGSSTSLRASLKNEKRARVVLAILLAVLLSILNAGCKSQGTGNNAGGNPANGNSNGAAGEVYATPPFQTREPERYQAQMILNFTLDEHHESASTFIARDGDRRREDYEPAPNVKASDLQTTEGHFLLLHDAKLYAEVTPETGGSVPGPLLTQQEDFAPDLLINESRTEARYEKLGVEELNGRSATKYRVTILSAAGANDGAQVVQGEQFIWIDERLGMPVRSEATSTGASGVETKYIMEMLNVKEEVDGSVFAVPQNYKKVAMREILARIAAAKSPAKNDETSAKAQGKDD